MQSQPETRETRTHNNDECNTFSCKQVQKFMFFVSLTKVEPNESTEKFLMNWFIWESWYVV